MGMSARTQYILLTTTVLVLLAGLIIGLTLGLQTPAPENGGSPVGPPRPGEDTTMPASTTTPSGSTTTPSGSTTTPSGSTTTPSGPSTSPSTSPSTAPSTTPSSTTASTTPSSTTPTATPPVDATTNILMEQDDVDEEVFVDEPIAIVDTVEKPTNVKEKSENEIIKQHIVEIDTANDGSNLDVKVITAEKTNKAKELREHKDSGLHGGEEWGPHELNDSPPWPASSTKGFKYAAVTTDTTPCSTIGTDILGAGGSAVDAAVAAGICVGVVNHHNSGIGGGHFMTIYESPRGTSTKELNTIQAREWAPLAATQDMFVNNTDASSKECTSGPYIHTAQKVPITFSSRTLLCTSHRHGTDIDKVVQRDDIWLTNSSRVVLETIMGNL